MSDTPSLAEDVLKAHIAYKGDALCGATLTGADPEGKPQCAECAWAAIDQLCAAQVDRDRLALIIRNVEALAEKWRYKGEFGWGPWQAGEGPDQEGETLDHAAYDILAITKDDPS